MASNLEALISQIQKNIPDGELKATIISSFQNLCNEIQGLNSQVQNLNHENNCMKQINTSQQQQIILSNKLIEAQEKLIHQNPPCFEMPYSDLRAQPSSFSTTNMEVTPPQSNIPVGPTLIQNGITGVVKFFNYGKNYGIISFKTNENGNENLKEAFIHATNIAKSKIEKPENRNLQQDEAVVFDLYDIGNNKFIAKNVTGPNDSNVQGVYVVYQNKNTQNTRIPNQRQPQINYRNQHHPRSQSRSQSRPRSQSVRRIQNQYDQRQNYHQNDFQEVGQNRIFRSQRQY